MRAPTTAMALFTAIALVACSTPRMSIERSGDTAYGEDEEQQSNNVILLAAGSRPPPRAPPPPPRPPGRLNVRDKEHEPARPGRVPGRRLAGPPDAPYWEPVFEITWRGGGLQGPKPTPPQHPPGEAGPSAPAIPRAQPDQPLSRPPTQASQHDPNAAPGGGGTPSPALRGTPYHPDAIAARVRPPYRANPAHDPGSPMFNPRKTPEPADAALTYTRAVRAENMGTWFGRGAKGWYQYFSDNAGGVHFGGIVRETDVPAHVRRTVGP